jgi:hypothetical protein
MTYDRTRCVDCEEGARPRKVTRPGPRCNTHQRARKKKSSTARWEAYILATYNITAQQYWTMYEEQGGVCAICQRATGRTKHLSVDHDHACCHRPPTCGHCVRGLLCTTCNKLLGHLRDDPLAGVRIHDYLEFNHLKRIRRNGK